MDLQKVVVDIQKKIGFSGTVLVENKNKILINKSFGFANRSDQLRNTAETRFGIASGCKLFTAIAICQLVEIGKLSLDSRVRECLKFPLPYMEEKITVHHLLTHTSGIADYFDESEMDDFEELWIKQPMYHLRNIQDFLPLFQNKPMKAEVGRSFHYNNAGYILLGLMVEEISGISFCEYIEKNIFHKAGMKNSGYFSFDTLPRNTALGYIDHQDGTWRTNIYSLPVRGGSDGGAFVTASDMAKLWDALWNNLLLSDKMTKKLLQPHVKTNNDSFYGYGLWIKNNGEKTIKYHVMGYDPGVSFHSAYYPEKDIKTVVCSNKSEGAFEIYAGIEESLVFGRDN